jgi:hypothetical protein
LEFSGFKITHSITEVKDCRDACDICRNVALLGTAWTMLYIKVIFGMPFQSQKLRGTAVAFKSAET